MIKSKKQMFLIITIFTLVMMLGTVSYAFFNYTRTGSSNNVRVGRVNFSSSENNTINLTNVFPTDSAHLDSSNSSTVTINITGDTNYDKGIEYKVSLVDVNNVVNNKEVPIGYSVTASNLGTKSNDYYNDRGSTTNVFNLRESGITEEGQDILIGYIKPDENGVNGSINITAFIDKNEVGISDTVSRIVNDNLVYGETDAEWIAGRTILTTEEWNSLSTNGISFKVKVEANEGLWVNEPNQIVLKNLNGIQEWKDIRANVTSIEFRKDGIIPENSISSFDATDLSSEGPITVYTVDDGLGNNTYKAIIVANDEIYAPEDCLALFLNCTNLVSINSENFKVDNVTSMNKIFGKCNSLKDITSLSSWNVSNVTNMSYIFRECYELENLNALANWDTGNVETMSNAFYGCKKIKNINSLLYWNTSNVKNMVAMFALCELLININGLSNWNVSNVQDMYSMFFSCTSLENLRGLDKWDVRSLANAENMFAGCSNLVDVGSLHNWNTQNLSDMATMFDGCSKLEIIDLSALDMSKVTNNYGMFQKVGFEILSLPNNYTRIDNFMFNHNDSYIGSSFTIPNSVTYIGNSHIFYNFGKDGIFNKFIVESGNTSFKTINDILYTYDGTRLISVPRGKTFVNNTFEIPEGVTFLNELSFSINQNIDTLVLPNSYVIERYIDANNNSYGFINSGNSLSVAVYQYTSIKRYEVKNDNTRYSSDSGCIYSKDGSELISVPLHYTGILNIKSGTTTIGQEAFWTGAELSNIDAITQINIPASVTTIESNQLTLLNSLMRRSENPVTITIDSGNTAYQIVNNQIVAR